MVADDIPFSSDSHARAFATVVILLPTEFSGSTLRLSHGGLSISHEPDQSGPTATFVAGWHVDATCNFSAITSGHCLALSYNLIFPANSPRPSLSDGTDAVGQLSAVFQQWKDEAFADTPEKIVYLLEGQYGEEEGLTMGALQSADACKAALVHMVAQQHGLGVGFGVLKLHLSGGSEDGVEFCDYSNDEMVIKDIVDLQGTVVAPSMGKPHEDETIPYELSEAIQEGQCDGEDFNDDDVSAFFGMTRDMCLPNILL